MVEENLRKSEREIDREKLVEIFEDVQLLVDAIGFRMSKNEVGNIN